MPLATDLESVRAWLQAATGLTIRISAKPSAITRTGIDLWPWRIEEDAAARNRLPSPRADSQTPPAALKLYFLALSARGLDGLDQVHQALHDHPALIVAGRRLLLKPHPLDAAQADALFTAAQCPLRPFLGYELRGAGD